MNIAILRDSFRYLFYLNYEILLSIMNLLPHQLFVWKYAIREQREQNKTTLCPRAKWFFWFGPDRKKYANQIWFEIICVFIRCGHLTFIL